MTIQIENRQKRVKIEKRKIRQDVTKLMKLLNCADMEVSISLVSDEEIQRINQQYLFKDRPTNVISFSLQEGEYGGVNPRVLGDIVISVDTALRDAEKGSLTFENEITFLIIHGLLHLMGYNHENTSRANARKMKMKENELFELMTQNHRF
ncbi:MAG: rRNA maturation RNase YbeY [Syntrophaceae bacterium]|jgi:probable rRNA maturation factor|nr:rRNA maturation RNase YbeY [Syntrophaceae bacterium]HQM44436.1 rRNA maturation RNase YbeY [Smithellaceae bacterium]